MDYKERVYKKWKARGGGMDISDSPEERKIITEIWQENSKRDKELEKARQQYNRYFKEMQEHGKISPSWFPKTIFDHE